MIRGQILMLFEYGLEIINVLSGREKYDSIILAVAHDEFLNLDIRSFLSSEKGVVYDVKGILPRKIVDARL